MGCFAPETLPVLSGLAKGYAVCDHWFSSVPTETLPNRAFHLRGNQPGAHGRQDAHVHLAVHLRAARLAHGCRGPIYGYDAQPLTKATFTDISGAAASHSGCFTDFTAAAAAGTLGAFTFLEPSWSSTGNSQHPNYNVALGEQLITTCTRRFRGGPGWAQTLLVITTTSTAAATTTCRPPAGATAPDNDAGEFRFSTSPGSGCGSRPCWCRR